MRRSWRSRSSKLMPLVALLLKRLSETFQT
jgi:hypothetical protein